MVRLMKMVFVVVITVGHSMLRGTVPVSLANPMEAVVSRKFVNLGIL
jgi:hypothetical protein